MQDLTQYQPPGVYVDDISTPIISRGNTGIVESLLCIVAPAIGYQGVNQSGPLFSMSDLSLNNTNVMQDASLVLTAITGAILVKNTDYSVTVDTTGAEPVTKIRRLPVAPGTVSPSGVVDGNTVRVAYHYTPANYYAPKDFTDFGSVVATYGTPLSSVTNATDPVASPLSLAAQVAFENGASRIIALAVKYNGTDWRSDFATAYGLVLTDHRVSLLVAVPPSDQSATLSQVRSFAADLNAHCNTAAANASGRMGLMGASVTFDETISPFEGIATGLVSKRIILAYPTKMSLYNPNTSSTVTVGGGYLAAAYGGRLSLNPVQKPLTKQPVFSFVGIPVDVQQRMTMAFKNNLSSQGVTVTETNRTNNLVVRHGVTTAPTPITSQEISLVRVADNLLQNVQVGMENSGAIGQPITPDLTIAVKGALIGVLDREVTNATIISYSAVLVRQEALPNGNPSVIECTFAYKPAIPLNYITVSFSIDLSTGLIQTDATTTA